MKWQREATCQKQTNKKHESYHPVAFENEKFEVLLQL